MGFADSPARDLVAAIAVVGAILLVLTLYTGNWPPVVVVESNSMMHVDVSEYKCRGSSARGCDPGTTRSDDTSYGRFGTIDPGDLVLVKEVGRIQDVALWVDGGRDHYGSPGDVVVYKPGGGEDTPIIHRAMTFVWVRNTGDSPAFIVKWSPSWSEPSEAACTAPGSGNYTCTFGNEDGVTIDALNLRGMRPRHNGIITKGDNAATNTAADQVLFTSDNPSTPWNENLRDRPIRYEWLQGVARGEIPWFGLIKLGLTESGKGVCYPVKNCEMASHPYYWTIGNVVAPRDMWVMLVVGLFVVTVAPVLVDVGLAYRHSPDRKKGSDWTLLEGTKKD